MTQAANHSVRPVLSDRQKADSAELELSAEIASFSKGHQLSDREAQVFSLLIGNVITSEEIGLRLGVTHNTVSNHLKSILRKTGAASKTQLLALFIARFVTDLKRSQKYCRRPSVLVIDQDPAICEWIGGNLSRRGLRVFTAGDGATAQNLLMSEKIDFVVSDFLMPDLGGLSLLKSLRQKHLYAPVVIFTAGKSSGLFEPFPENAAFEILCKPIDLDLLHSIIVAYAANEADIDFHHGSSPDDESLREPIDLPYEFRLDGDCMGPGGAFIPIEQEALGRFTGLDVGRQVRFRFTADEFGLVHEARGEVVWKRIEAASGLKSGLGVRIIALGGAGSGSLSTVAGTRNLATFIPQDLRAAQSPR